jgi:Mrp family chromosome partitioning ATPase
MVIIDTPPVLGFADALLWSKMADGIVLVSFVGHTPKPDLKEAFSRLKDAGARILGTVVNNVRVQQSYRRYGYGYGYGYGGNGQDMEKRARRRGKSANMLIPGQGQDDSTKS